MMMMILGTVIAILGFLFFLNGLLSTPETSIHQVYGAIYLVGGAAVGTLGLILAQLGEMHRMAKPQKKSEPTHSQKMDALFKEPEPQPSPTISRIEEIETRSECPHCGQHFSYSARASGTTTNCVHCGNKILLS